MSRRVCTKTTGSRSSRGSSRTSEHVSPGRVVFFKRVCVCRVTPGPAGPVTCRDGMGRRPRSLGLKDCDTRCVFRKVRSASAPQDIETLQRFVGAFPVDSIVFLSRSTRFLSFNEKPVWSCEAQRRSSGFSLVSSRRCLLVLARSVSASQELLLASTVPVTGHGRVTPHCPASNAIFVLVDRLASAAASGR